MLSFVFWTGCRATPEYQGVPQPILLDNFRASPPLSPSQILPQRVVVISNRRAVQPQLIESNLKQSLASELSALQLFEVITPPGADCMTSLDELLHGQFNEAEMIEIARRYNSDAILLYRIDQFNAYGNMGIDASIALLDVNEMVLIFAADGRWTLDDPDTLQNYRNFLCLHRGIQRDIGIDVKESSPREFLSYVASQIAQSVRQ